MTWRNLEHPINRDRRSRAGCDVQQDVRLRDSIAIIDLHLKARGTWRSITHQRIILNMIQSQPFIKRVITAEIKTDENAFGALDQDRTDGVSSVISKARDVASSWQSISNPKATT